jgi:hypothetical protein
MYGRGRNIVATQALDHAAVLQTVRTWPADEQVALVQEVLQQLRGHLVEEPIAPPNSRGLAGLIANGQTPPTDEEVERWLDEHQMEKYGH